MPRFRFAFPLLLALLVAAACDLPNEPGPQPTTIIETPFEPGLNILGVLRLDDQPGASFIYIEQAYEVDALDTVGLNEFFYPIVADARVSVQGLREDTATYTFTYGEDSLRGPVYTNPDFIPRAGEEYALTITHPELPTLTDTAVVPARPAVDSTSLVAVGQTVAFSLPTSVDTYLYDIYLLSPVDSLHYRLVSQDGDPVPVAFNIAAGPGQPVELQIYGYDANLAEYLTSSVTIKPQSYQETVTTVTGGYGVFGAVSVRKMTVAR